METFNLENMCRSALFLDQLKQFSNHDVNDVADNSQTNLLDFWNDRNPVTVPATSAPRVEIARMVLRVLLKTARTRNALIAVRGKCCGRRQFLARSNTELPAAGQSLESLKKGLS